MKKMPILPLSLALSLAVSIPASAVSLSDVSGPYAQSIDNLVQRGVLQGDGTGSYRPEEALTRSAAASMLYEAFCLVPVFSMEAPAPEAGEDGSIPEPTTKAFYSTSTTVATLDAALMPAAPDAVGTWAETVANTVLDHDPDRVCPGRDESGLRRGQGDGLPGPGPGGRTAPGRSHSG